MSSDRKPGNKFNRDDSAFVAVPAPTGPRPGSAPSEEAVEPTPEEPKMTPEQLEGVMDRILERVWQRKDEWPTVMLSGFKGSEPVRRWSAFVSADCDGFRVSVPASETPVQIDVKLVRE